MGCADWAPNQRQIIIVHSHSQTHLSAACRQEAIRRCRARQGKATAQPLCGAGEERNCQWPFRQRARRRAEERNSLSSEKHSCLRLPPAYKKRDPKRSLSFVELEKKGTAGGRSASERGEEPRSGTPSSSPLFSCLRLPPAYKKRDPKRSLSFVELEGVEPSSKQVTDVLSTCLSYG